MIYDIQRRKKRLGGEKRRFILPANLPSKRKIKHLFALKQSLETFEHIATERKIQSD
jgi:hypothetical protein